MGTGETGVLDRRAAGGNRDCFFVGHVHVAVAGREPDPLQEDVFLALAVAD